MVDENSVKLEFILEQGTLSFEKLKQENSKIINYSYQFLSWMILFLNAELTYMAQRVIENDNKGAFCVFLIFTIHLFAVFKYLIPLTKIKDSYVGGIEPDSLFKPEVFDHSYAEILAGCTKNLQEYIKDENNKNTKIAKLFSSAINWIFAPLLLTGIGYLIFFIVVVSQAKS